MAVYNDQCRLKGYEDTKDWYLAWETYKYLYRNEDMLQQQKYETETWEKANKILSPLLKNFAILDGYGDAVKCNGIKVKDLEEAQTRQDLVVKEYCQHGDRLAYLVCSKSNEEIRINLAGEVLLNFLEEDE